jgi:hypothetical protein
MGRRGAAAALTILASSVLTAASAAAAGWDATPLPVSTSMTNLAPLGPFVETTDDGAAWVAWSDGQYGPGLAHVLVRRISPGGVVGEERVLTDSSPGNNGAIALAPLPGGDVRIAYATDSGGVLALRRLTPTSTGDPVTLYDKATEDDGNVGDNGNVHGSSVKVLAAPGGASWVSFRRLNTSLPNSIVSARRIDGDDVVGPLAAVTQPSFESDAAVDLLGGLVIVMPSGALARTVVVHVDTNGDVSGEVEVRPADAGPSASSETPAIGIDGAGIATVGWDFNKTVRSLQVRRVDTTTTSLTPLGAGPATLDDGLPADYSQFGPLFGVDTGGAVLMSWNENDSFQDNNDALVRVLGPGALAAVGVVGPRLQLDGPPPEAGYPSDLVPDESGLVTALTYTGASLCQASRIDLATGDNLGTDVLAATGCAGPMGPASGANGTVAAWSRYGDLQVVLSRYVTAPPACADGAPVTVVAGASATLPLACTGWRPVLAVTGAPSRGALGAIDQAAGTVTYTAGTGAGSDLVRFRATNAAGNGAERSVAVTVTPAPSPPGPPNPAPPDGADRIAPGLTGLTIKPRRVSLRKLRAPALTFSLSEAARVDVAVQRLVAGRRKGKTCVTKPKPRRGARCTKATTVKRLSKSLPAGASRLAISLRRGAAKLPAGSYRVVVVATDAAGNASGPQRVSFKVTGR